MPTTRLTVTSSEPIARAVEIDRATLEQVVGGEEEKKTKMWVGVGLGVGGLLYALEKWEGEHQRTMIEHGLQFLRKVRR